MTRVAAFLDRDGTLIVDEHYLADATRVQLLPGAAESVAAVNASGLLAVVATNQSGIARGLITPAQYEAVRHRLDDLLEASGAHLDASYLCPHGPPVSGPCDCRKPAVGMYVQAARDHNIDLAASLYVGDKRRDVEPALTLGGVGILIPNAETPPEDASWAREHATVLPTLGDAVAWFLAQRRTG